MPIYDYKCSACGRVSEHIIISTCHADLVCPSCGGKKLSKISCSTFAVGRSSSSEKACAHDMNCGSCCSNGKCHLNDE